MNEENKKYICPVCGYAELSELPWGEDNLTPTFEICSCCGVEFGYEDNNEHSKRKYVNKWIEKNTPWFNPEEKPGDWNLKDQIDNIKGTECYEILLEYINR